MSLAYAVLAILRDRARHGYAVRRALEEEMGAFWPVNHGQVYATLDRLVHAGLLRSVGPEPGSSRRRFALTASGRRSLQSWLARPAEPIALATSGFDDWLAHLAIAVRRGDRELLSRTLEVQRRRCETLHRGNEQRPAGFAERATHEILTAEILWLEAAARELLGGDGGA